MRSLYCYEPIISKSSNMASGNRELAIDAIADSDDPLTEILLCLPIKSLLRFKSVSKHWKSLISSPQFSRRLYPDGHLVSGLILRKSFSVTNPEHDFVPLRDMQISVPFKSLPLPNHPSGLRILQSCNGLLCCSSLRNRKLEHDYYVLNPTTKRLVRLPRPSTARIHGINMAYDPAKSPYYKVVCVRDSDSAEGRKEDYLSCQIEIYSSETRTWRISGDPFIAHVHMLYKSGVFWNGAIHWINCHDTSLYFNVDEEQRGEMPIPSTAVPDDWKFGRRFRYFGESRDHLHLVEIYAPCVTKFNVYEMERDYSRWFVKYTVDLDAITVAFPEMISDILSPAHPDYYRFSILSVIREANDAESFMVVHVPGKAIRYNLNDKTFDKICDFGSVGDSIGGGVRYWASLVQWLHAYQYIETLACI